MQVSPITTHVLDTSRGCPAAGVAVELSILIADNWQALASGTTNFDGRVADLLPGDYKLCAGTYRLRFQTGGYFQANGLASFYPCVDVTFELVTLAEHYHIPLLLSPFGYSTYRGS